MNNENPNSSSRLCIFSHIRFSYERGVDTPYALFRKKCKLVNEGCRFFDTFVGGNVEASFLLGVANFVKSIASIWIYW
ncbi:MAG: hypothetical protein BA861_10945 [Desulfobacterales bacterium S3730MH5]|nr:MAG: hypothetical protein BA861_10945 [Desulfobacterales bacterium S3730MH5]